MKIFPTSRPAALVVMASLTLATAAGLVAQSPGQNPADAPQGKMRGHGEMGEWGRDKRMVRGRMMEMHRQMMAEAKAQETELDALLAEMNTSIGDKKIQAMAAVLNKMVEQRKALTSRMSSMQERFQNRDRKPDAQAAPPAPAIPPAAGTPPQPTAPVAPVPPGPR